MLISSEAHVFFQIMRWFSNWILETSRLKMNWRNSSRCADVCLCARGVLDVVVFIMSLQLLESSTQAAEKSQTAATAAQTPDPVKLQQLQEEQRKQEAVMLKDRVSPASFTCQSSQSDVIILISLVCVCIYQGNAYFKEGKYEAAVECYTKGIEADNTNALLSANRAMAYLKLHRWRTHTDCIYCMFV